jgi:CRISPR-associated protein (TIGR02710 family)
MSVAAVLATIEFSSQYFYVGSRDPSGRDREGIGVVLDGKEFSWFQTNPWEELAVRDRKEIALLFNHGRYADARERAMRLARVVPEEMRKIYEALADLIEGYALWDRFEFREAQVKISKSCAVLKTYLAGRDDPLRMTIEQVEAQLPFLRGLCERSKAAQRLDALDMLANAERRAVKAQKYDDAVARLYAVLEGLARNRLASKYDIKTNCVRPDQVPERLRERYKCLYQDPDKPEDGLRLGLQASYHLLAELKDELGMKYLQYENELNRVLNARNQSRLAHGTEPVKSETYHKLREIIMVFAEAKEEDLPIFPEMRL